MARCSHVSSKYSLVVVLLYAVLCGDDVAHGTAVDDKQEGRK